MHRARNMAATHPNRDRLLPPAGWREPSKAAGQEATAGAERDDADAAGGFDGAMSAEDDGDGRSNVGGEDDDRPDIMTDDEEAGAPALDSDSKDKAPRSGDAADEDPPQLRNDGMERGTLAFGGLRIPAQTGSVFARIAELYAAMTEADEAVPGADPDLVERPTFFDTPVLQQLLCFIVTCGGGGLTKSGQLMLAKVLLAMKPDQDGQLGEATLHDKLGTLYSLVTAVLDEEGHGLADRSWLQVLLSVGLGLHNYFDRNALDCVVQAFKNAEEVQLVGEALPPGADGERRRSRTMDSIIFLEEQAEVQRIHGPDAKIVVFRLHADEAVIS